jgi:hypothetical protein
MDDPISKPLRGPGPSGWIGVSWNKNSRKWVAVMRVRGRFYRLGLFETAESAARARAHALAKALAATE